MGATAESGGEHIFEALRDDHDTQRTLVSILVDTQGDSDGRRETFDKVRRELQAHAAAEYRSDMERHRQHD